MMEKFWHWLTEAENPIVLYGFLPAVIWYVIGVCFFAPFGVAEYMGAKRIHGMVPLTWVLRCIPRWVDFLIIAVAIWHFIFKTTRP
jgi:hypothetical protein